MKCGCGAVNQRRKIKLAGNIGTFFNINAPDLFTLRAGLMGNQCHAQHAGRFGAHLIDGFDDFHAAALAAPTGVNLRFHNPDGPAQFLGRRDRFIGAKSDKPTRHRTPNEPRTCLA